MNRWYEGLSDQLCREAGVNKGLRRTLFGASRVRRTRERIWQPVVLSHRPQFRYDGLNRVTEIADARQGITRFGYDGNGNLLSVQDAKLQPTSYTYDSMDQLFTRKDALNRSESYQYDPAGNLTTFTDRKAQPATFTYDALNRRTRADYADSSFTTFTYDAVGRLTRATGSTSGAIDFFYDNLDRLILEVTPLGAVAYEYDAIGRRTTMTVAGQAPVTYQYDTASRLTQVAQGALVVGLGYDNANRRTSLTYPNGTSTAYTYDNASRLMSITHNGPSGVLESLAYTYDAAGNRTSLVRTNGTASLLPSAVASASYDAANQQTQFAGVTHTFDANGSLTSDGTSTYTWDVRNRLVGISGGTTASFSYDSLGRRGSKTISGATTQFVYDGNDVMQDINSGAVAANYLRSLNIDEPFIRKTSSGNEHYHVDALDSSLALSDASGALATTYAYEPFGKTTVTGTSPNAFQFTGRENDGTGLFYYRARYYSSKLQRFISEDPLEYEGGEANLYIYVRNNPLVFTDPWGLKVDLTKIGRLRDPLEKVKGTKKGKELYDTLEQSKTIYKIREREPGDPGPAFYNKRTNEIVVDPGFHPNIQWGETKGSGVFS